MNASLQDHITRLTAWASETLREIEITFEAPSRRIDRTCICLYAFGLEDLDYRYRTTRARPPSGFRIRYLVTTWASTPTEAEGMLARLLLAAMDEAGFDVELTATDPRLWQSFGILPRPAFFLVTSIHVSREEESVRRARQAPRLGIGEAVPLIGRVLGPGDRPLARARVEMPSLDRATYTDDDGRFGFRAVPTEPDSRELRIRAAGLVRSITLDSPSPQGEPVLVRFDLREDEL